MSPKRDKFWEGIHWARGWYSYADPSVLHLTLTMKDFEAIQCQECGVWTKGEWWNGLKCGHEIS